MCEGRAELRCRRATSTIRRPPRTRRNTKRGICFSRPRCRDGDGPSATCGDEGDDGGGGGSGRSDSGGRGRRATAGRTVLRVPGSCTLGEKKKKK